MSKLTDFYRGIGHDTDGRSIDYILSQSDGYLECDHSYIQWLFPLIEPSNFNIDAPLLTPDDINLFNADPELAINLNISFQRFIRFLGLEYDAPNFNRLDNFNEYTFLYINHNWLRITRMLKCLKVLGLTTQAEDFYEFLVMNNYGSENSKKYWAEAIS